MNTSRAWSTQMCFSASFFFFFLITLFSCFQDGQSRTIRQFQFTDWPEQGVPKTGEGFIDFIGQVHKTKEQFGQDGPITVHCRYPVTTHRTNPSQNEAGPAGRQTSFPGISFCKFQIAYNVDKGVQFEKMLRCESLGQSTLSRP